MFASDWVSRDLSINFFFFFLTETLVKALCSILSPIDSENIRMSWKLVLQLLTIVINANSIFVFISRRRRRRHSFLESEVGLEEKHIHIVLLARSEKKSNNSINLSHDEKVFFLQISFVCFSEPHTRRREAPALDRELWINSGWKWRFCAKKKRVGANQMNDCHVAKKHAENTQQHSNSNTLEKEARALREIIKKNGNRRNSSKQINYTHEMCRTTFLGLLTLIPNF